MTKMASSFIFFMALPLLVSVALSFPFPYAKKIWIHEVGYYGLINSILFILIALAIEKNMSWAAVFAGLGLCLHEEFMDLRGFIYLFQLEAFNPFSILYFALSLLFTIFFAGILAYTFYALELSDKYHLRPDSVPPRFAEKGFFNSSSFFVYSAALAVLYWLVPPNAKTAFLILRFIGAFVFMNATICIGFEAYDFFKKAQLKFALRLLLHEACLAWIIWLVYAKLPFRELVAF